MVKRAFAPRAEILEGRRLCAVESTAGAVASYGAALGDSLATAAEWADNAVDNTIHYPSPFADPNPDAPTADPTTQEPGAGGNDLDEFDDAALDELYRSGGPEPFFALPYPQPFDAGGDGFGGNNSLPAYFPTD
jgi:hypothetical protein